MANFRNYGGGYSQKSNIGGDLSKLASVLESNRNRKLTRLMSERENAIRNALLSGQDAGQAIQQMSQQKAPTSILGKIGQFLTGGRVDMSQVPSGTLEQALLESKIKSAFSDDGHSVKVVGDSLVRYNPGTGQAETVYKGSGKKQVRQVGNTIYEYDSSSGSLRPLTNEFGELINQPTSLPGLPKVQKLGGQKPVGTRFQELIDSGQSEEEAYQTLYDEGYRL